MFDVAEGRGPECEYGGAHLGIGDDLDAEDVREPWTAIIPEGSENEVLSFLVEHQYS